MRVLSIRSTGPDPLGHALPGTAVVGFRPPPATSDYGAQVLGAEPNLSPGAFWDSQFGPSTLIGIPLSRVDLSGFGTSTFSDWREKDPNAAGVVRALFNVLIGRTAHELVQLQTWILPFCIRMQRTIVFDRSDGGEVVKHDSGWVAVGDGAFELLDAGSLMWHPNPAPI
jgi:hypothetical protein